MIYVFIDSLARRRCGCNYKNTGCRQAIGHYLNQYWTWPMSPYDVITAQCVNYHRHAVRLQTHKSREKVSFSTINIIILMDLTWSNDSGVNVLYAWYQGNTIPCDEREVVLACQVQLWSCTWLVPGSISLNIWCGIGQSRTSAFMDAWIIGNNLGIFVNYRVPIGSVQNAV